MLAAVLSSAVLSSRGCCRRVVVRDQRESLSVGKQRCSCRFCEVQSLGELENRLTNDPADAVMGRLQTSTSSPSGQRNLIRNCVPRIRESYYILLEISI